MADIRPKERRATSARPTNLFLLTQCVELFGVLDAAILAELYYWIAKGDEPWRKAQEHADLFSVNEKTIRRHSIDLAKKHQCFGRRDSMLKNGKKGACKYFAKKGGNSKALKEQYQALFNRGFNKTDFGECMTGEVVEVQRFVTLPVAFIERLKDIEQAYLLARLYWITFSENPSLEFRFSSQNRLAKAMFMNRTTLMRYLDLLQEKNYLEHSCSTSGIVILINGEADLYELMDIWVSEKQELREELIREGNH
tara:strand:+ start:1275 stop:2033 length:759 start_codon:yes stop_codon:yes gene_type:complete